MKENRDILQRWAKVFEADAVTLERHACSGKWHGYTDYFLRVNGASFTIGNSCSGQKALQDYFETGMQIYERFAEVKADLLQKLKDLQAADDKMADTMGFNRYEILDVDYYKAGLLIGWFYVKINVNGRVFCHHETGLDGRIRNFIENREFPKPHENYYTAGGLHDSQVDYVFHGTGFCSKNHFYKGE